MNDIEAAAEQDALARFVLDKAKVLLDARARLDPKHTALHKCAEANFRTSLDRYARRTAALAHATRGEGGAYIDIVFDGPPGPESGRFVEVEDATGKSIDAGMWRKREDGLWALRVVRAIASEQATRVDTMCGRCGSLSKGARNYRPDLKAPDHNGCPDPFHATPPPATGEAGTRGEVFELTSAPAWINKAANEIMDEITVDDDEEYASLRGAIEGIIMRALPEAREGKS